MSSSNKQVLIILGIVLFAAVSRLLPHPHNMTPMVAICLVSVAFIKNNNLKFIVPAIAIVFSDVLIEKVTGFGFHSGTVLVYGAFATILLLGVLLLKKVTFFKTIVASIGSSILFFLVTNFALFYTASPVNNPAIGAYRHDLSGILSSYEAGLPFFRNMLIGDLLFTGILFGAYFAATRVFKLESLQSVG